MANKDSVNLPFLVPIAVMGMPMSSEPGGFPSGKSQAIAAGQGGKVCFNWVFQYGAIARLAKQMPKEAPHRADSEYGDYEFHTVVKTADGANIDVALRSCTSMLAPVVSGATAATIYEHNGQTYNIVGSIEQTIAFNGSAGWIVTMPLMLLSSVPIPILSKIAFKNFLKPIISRMYRGIRKALTTEVTEAFDAIALESAADAAAVEASIAGEVVEEVALDATLSLETGGLALVAVVALIALQIAAGFLFHPSYHRLIIYNFTNYELAWEPPFLEHGCITLEPVTDATGRMMARTLPPMTKSSPSKFVAPVTTAAMADWGIYSNSKVHGVKWGMSFTLRDPKNRAQLGVISSQWDIPLDKSNSIGLRPNIDYGYLKPWMHDSDTHQQHMVEAVLPIPEGRIVVSNGIDYLHDKHLMSPDTSSTGYIYRSVLVFEQFGNDLHICVGENGDGRLESFLIGADQGIYHQWQTAPGQPGTGWKRLGGDADTARNLAVFQNADTRLEVFAIGTDGCIHQAWQSAPNSSWKPWAQLGTIGQQARDLAVGRHADGRLAAFVVGTDAGIYGASQLSPNGTWSEWARLGTQADQAQRLTLGRNADGRLELFAVGLDGGIYHVWQSSPSGAWKAWARLGTTDDKAQSLAVGANADGHLELFAVGLDSGIYHVWQSAPNGSWKAWQRLGTTDDKARQLAVGRNANGSLEVFAIGLNQGIYHIGQNVAHGGWHTWERFGPDTDYVSALCVASNHDGRMDLMTLGINCRPYRYSQTKPNGGWSDRIGCP